MNGGWQHETTEESGWDQWLAQNAPGLLLFARLRSRCEADAQDLVQDAVFESWKRQPKGVPPPLGLVFITIRRRAIDLARRDNRRSGREMAAHRDTEQDWFDTSLEDRERGRLIQHALGNLPEEQREVVTLKIWRSLTFEEIASALEIPANTAASRYRYGLAELRKMTKEILT